MVAISKELLSFVRKENYNLYWSVFGLEHFKGQGTTRLSFGPIINFEGRKCNHHFLV